MAFMQNQVALVVGASSGIGRATAAMLAGAGARVMAAARREDRLKQLQGEMSAAGTPVEIFAADATSVPAMEKLVEHTRERLGEIDILVYASGTNTPERALTRLTPAVWDKLIQVNLNGAFYATYAVLPRMRERGAGHLIYIASVSGLMPDVSGAAYQASKRGMVGLAHAIRVEEKEHGIRTCVICPGLVDTEILEFRPVKPSAETLAKALQPEDVAAAVIAVAQLPARVVVPEMQIVPTYL